MSENREFVNLSLSRYDELVEAERKLKEYRSIFGYTRKEIQEDGDTMEINLEILPEMVFPRIEREARYDMWGPLAGTKKAKVTGVRVHVPKKGYTEVSKGVLPNE